MNNLRDYYERALQEFGTCDDGKNSLKALKQTCSSFDPGDLHVDGLLLLFCYCLGLCGLSGTNPVNQAKEMHY